MREGDCGLEGGGAFRETGSWLRGRGEHELKGEGIRPGGSGEQTWRERSIGMEGGGSIAGLEEGAGGNSHGEQASNECTRSVLLTVALKLLKR